MQEFIDKLRPKAVYFKLSSKEKYGGAVNVDDIIKVLESIKESYKAYVEARYFNSIEKKIEAKNQKTIKTQLEGENDLMIVDLKFESCGMAFSPNYLTYTESVPYIENQAKWKDEIFEDYKLNVIQFKYNEKEKIEIAKKEFSYEQRRKIFIPFIVGVINNPDTKIEFGIGKPIYDIKIFKPTDYNYKSLIVNNNASDDSNIIEETRTTIATVEVSNRKTKPKVLELFDDLRNIILPLNEINFGKKKYILKHPIYCELVQENGQYLLENKQLGIYAEGNSLADAKENFYEDFNFIYERYNTLSNEKLSDDVIEIKNYLNLLIKK